MARPNPRKSGEPWSASRIVILVAILLPAVVSTLAVFSAHGTVELALEARAAEAGLFAESLANRLASGARPSPVDLLGSVPGAIRILVLDDAGRVRVRAGAPLEDDVFAGLGGPPTTTTVLAATRERPIRALAPISDRGRRETVRLDLGAEPLVSRERGLNRLIIVIVLVDLALLLWLVLFLGHLLEPYERILARARELDPDLDSADEANFLLETLEIALSRGREGPDGDLGELTALRETLAQSLDSGLLLLDRSGDVLVLNPAGAEILGLRETASGARLADLLSSHRELAERLTGAFDRQEALQRAEATVTVEGVERRLGFATTPLRRSTGSAIGFLVLFTDVTSFHERDLETQLGESLAELGELSAGVAHELRNSLSTIRGRLELLKRTSEQQERQEHLDELDLETRHLERVVRDFLAFARPERADIVHFGIDELARRLSTDPILGPVALVPEPAIDEPVTIAGDPHLLERALHNLLRNAREASSRAGRDRDPIDVAIRLTPDRSEVEIEIRDRGDGVPPSVRSRIFRPFVTGGEGVGLGLALAYRIVTMHGGRLVLDDRAGGGTVARVTLLRAAAEPSSQEPGSAPEDRRTGRDG